MNMFNDLTTASATDGGTGTKASIASGFGGASQTYDSASRLQKAMGDTLLSRIPESFRPESVLDLGCGTGWFTRKLTARFPEARVTGADLSPGMLAQAEAATDRADVNWLNADAEQLPLADQSVDLVFSNLMVQWSQQPEVVLAECQRVLRPGGLLVMSTLVDGTLRELKQAWAKADPGQPHVNRFVPAEHWRSLTRATLTGSELALSPIRLRYDTPMALNRELKHLGAVFKGEERRRTVTAPGRFRAMCRAYPGVRSGQVFATYEAGWLYWQKPTAG
ncbi:malonyl-ACP O-methyltransferase BioC [Marinobacter sp. S0848L]|uniref:malonyl-ACP O-methyltransferase BioC n=1 Tax=Marinobacter sp. S0848L TaxID=2926423 RepID=UPI001FF2C63E|nr:malonyl-ACP O-methyltransferase BioC [Marinobacter sp. S0848L]MCK0107031.1 malonyl-ACP O-methyltransferase BioC [Marinobacter sp. S0848L]